MNGPAADRLSAAALALALAAVTLAVLRPPELGGAGRLGLGLIAAAAALLFAWRPPAARSGAGLAAAWLLPLALASLLAAPCRSRALDEAAQVGALLLVGLLGAAAGREARAWRLIPILLAILAAGASFQALLQAHWLYPQQAAVLRATGAVATDNLILRLEDGRPAGPFVLPSSLAGFLALALPGIVVLAQRAASRSSRFALVAAMILVVYALILTRSLGGVAAAVGGLVLVLPAVVPRRRAAAGVLIAVAALLCTAWFLHQRRAEFDQGRLSDPLRLRAGNWTAAVQMIGDRPLLGVGPGSFGTAYPRYVREGMNETRYAHNSYLQAAACWGIWVLGPMAAFLLAFFRRIASPASGTAEPGPDEGSRLAVAAGTASFLVHNLVDFTFYLPGIAVPAATLLGMTLSAEGTPREDRHRWRPEWRLAAIAAALFVAWNAMIVHRVDVLMETALRAAGKGDVARAASAARRAAEVRPGSPEPWAFLAQLVLAHQMGDDLLKRQGLEASDRAVRLDPESAVLHHTRALYHAAMGERAPAYLEEYRAHRLYPLKQDYRLPPGEPAP